MLNKGEFKSFIFTGNKALCTGCGACAQGCPHNAICMTPDNEGFLYPKLDTEKCVGCGFCDMICPVTGKKTENKEYVQHCYVATTSHKCYYEESATIGICTMLSEYVIKHKGYVFGVYLDESNWNAYHIMVNDYKGVQMIRNSKYLQSSTKSTFGQAKKKLIEGSVVLYIGTPCQIAGLKAYLRRDYPNLFTVDLICHGVFSPILLPLEIEYWETKFGGKIKNFRFRSKKEYRHVNGGMVNFDLEKDGKVKHIERFAGSSPTYRCYAYAGDGNQYNHRISCYTCHFRSQHRYGDITVGDPWFISDSFICNERLVSSNPIRSLYSINSAKGEELMSNVRSYMVEKEICLSDAFRQPALLEANNKIPEKRNELYTSLKKVNYGSLVENLLNCNLDFAHRTFKRAYRKSAIKRIMKKLLFR